MQAHKLACFVLLQVPGSSQEHTVCNLLIDQKIFSLNPQSHII